MNTGDDPRAIALSILSKLDPSSYEYENKRKPSHEVEARVYDTLPAAMNLLLTVARNITVLDRVVLSFLRERNLVHLTPRVRNGLRLGAAEILFTQTPNYAAVSEWVTELKPDGKRFSALANAVLRKVAETAQSASEISVPADAINSLNTPSSLARCAQELAKGEGEWLEAMTELPPDVLSKISSHPYWLVDDWQKRFGKKLVGILSVSQRPHRQAIRWDAQVRGGMEQAEAELVAQVKATAETVQFRGREYSLIPPGESSLVRSAFEAGIISLQGVASQAAIQEFAPPETGLVLDACAGSGIKATQLALMMGGAKRLVACDISRPKLEELVANFERLKMPPPQSFAFDLTKPEDVSELQSAFPQGFQRIYIDAPCSGTGTLGRLPFKRFRVKPSDIAALAETQNSLIASCASLLAPGGDIVYITCSLLAGENEDVVAKSGLKAMGTPLTILPEADYLEGMFAARLAQP
jgi:16S rRNA (cytosine967-C5)-methyltransferase